MGAGIECVRGGEVDVGIRRECLMYEYYQDDEGAEQTKGRLKAHLASLAI